MPAFRPLGIDLGTTYSAMATIDTAGRSVMVPNSDGQTLTPSVVFFDAKKVVVGHMAKQMALTHTGDTAICVKRDMGKQFYSQTIRGNKLPPEVIQSCILKRLKDDVAAVHHQELAAVITVPAYFDDPRRRATAQAGEMAGLQVLDIVNEPTAAALAYGEQLGYLDPKTAQAKKPLKVLVYDLGGGTFDVTLLDLKPGDIQTIATDGDVKLGGRDWDEVLANYAAEQFVATHQLDPRNDPQSMTNLLLMAEQVKQSLTTHPSGIFEIRHAGKELPVPITKQKFEELSEVLLERTVYTTQQLMNTAGLEWNQIDRVLLVGGSTRMPMVTRMLHELAGKLPERGVHPDEAVARGAAIYANYLLKSRNKEGTKSFRVTNVNAHSLGIEGLDQRTQRKENVILIRRNTRLPAKMVKKFVTNKENQRSIVVNVLEGESRDPSHCSLIGRSAIRNLPEKLPAGWPVEVTYEYQDNGRLAVHANVPGTQQSVAIELQNSTGLDAEKLKRWKTVVSEKEGFDAFEDILEAVTTEVEVDKNRMNATTKNVAGSAGAQQGMKAHSAPPMAAAVEFRPDDAPKFQPAGFQQPQYQSNVPAIPNDGNPYSAPMTLEEMRAKQRRKDSAKMKRGLLLMFGYLFTSVVGLLIGYYIVAWVTPNGNALNLPLPWMPEKKVVEAKPAAEKTQEAEKAK